MGGWGSSRIHPDHRRPLGSPYPVNRTTGVVRPTAPPSFPLRRSPRRAPEYRLRAPHPPQRAVRAETTHPSIDTVTPCDKNHGRFS